MMNGVLSRRIARLTDKKIVDIRGRPPVISFTFDDLHATACNAGAEIIQDHDFRGTFYVSGRFERGARTPRHLPSVGHSADEIIELHRSGHEIACHGFGHLNYQKINVDEIEQDIRQNLRYLEERGIPRPRNFAYPFGCVSPAAKRACGQHFLSCRGVQSAINRHSVDLFLLKSVPLYSNSTSMEHVSKLISNLREHGGWLIFFTHGVTRKPEGGDVTPDMLTYALRLARSQAIEVRTVAEALSGFTEAA